MHSVNAHTPVTPVLATVRQVLAFLVRSLPHYLVETAKGAKEVFLFALILAACAILYTVFFRIYPRARWINHKLDMDAFLRSQDTGALFRHLAATSSQQSTAFHELSEAVGWGDFRRVATEHTAALQLLVKHPVLLADVFLLRTEAMRDIDSRADMAAKLALMYDYGRDASAVLRAAPKALAQRRAEMRMPGKQITWTDLGASSKVDVVAEALGNPEFPENARHIAQVRAALVALRAATQQIVAGTAALPVLDFLDLTSAEVRVVAAEAEELASLKDITTRYPAQVHALQVPGAQDARAVLSRAANMDAAAIDLLVQCPNLARLGVTAPAAFDRVARVLGDMARRRADYAAYQRFVRNCHAHLVWIMHLNLFTSEYADRITGIYNDMALTPWKFFLKLFRPYYDELYVRRVVGLFNQTFSKARYEQTVVRFQRFWDRLGKGILRIPFNAIRDKYSEREGSGADDADGPVHEGFLGGLFKGIVSIGKFFATAIDLVVTFAKLVADLVKDPINTLVRIFKFVVSTVIMVVLYVTYVIASMVSFIPLNVYFAATTVVPFVIRCAAFMALLALAGVVSLALMLLNLVPGRPVQALVLCHNSPAAWHEVPGTERGNAYHSLLFCASPCRKGFLPDKVTGLTCMRAPSVSPAFCPQAEIYRVFQGTSSGAGAYGDFRPTLRFLRMVAPDREAALRSYLVDRTAYLSNCARAMSRYDVAAKQVCHALPTVAGQDATKRANLTRLCRQAYCGPGARGGRFCHDAPTDPAVLRTRTRSAPAADSLRQMLAAALLVATTGAAMVAAAAGAASGASLDRRL
jgi:hypothetical protein